MRDESSTLDQLWHHLEELAREQQGRFRHVLEVHEKIHQLADERQRIEEEMMRMKAQPGQQEGGENQPQAGNGSATKLEELEREISRLQAEWVAFKEQNAQIKRTAGKILKRVPPGAPEADQLSRLAVVRGGGLTFEEIEDDLVVLRELAANRKRTGESVDTSKGTVNLADPSRAEGDSAQRDKGTMAGSTQGVIEDHVVSESVEAMQDVPSHSEAPEPIRRRGRPQRFTSEQKRTWVRRRDKERASLVSLAREMYPEEDFTELVRHRVEAALSRFRKQFPTECAAIDETTAKTKNQPPPVQRLSPEQEVAC